LRADNSVEAFLLGDDTERIRYDQFREQFDRDDRVIVIIRAPEIFDLAFLERLRDLHRDIEASVPYLDEVTSLVNARNTRGDGEQLIVEDLLERWPRNSDELAMVRDRALGNPLYRNILISESGKLTALSLKPFTYSQLPTDDDALEGFDDSDGAGSEPAFLTEKESAELVAALVTVIDRHATSGFEIHAVGGPMFDYSLMKTMQRDASSSIGLALIVISVLLLLLFRSLMGLLMPLLVIVTSLLSSLGIMVLLDIPFSVTLNMLPAFLLVVGVCDSVHILVIVVQRLAAGESREEAICQALGHSGLAVVMTSVTTAAGLVSFSIAELLPIAQLGVIAPIGVMLAMAYTLVLLPALAAIVPDWLIASPGGARTRAFFDGSLAWIGDVSTQHPGRVIAVTAAVMLFGLGGLMQVRFSHDGIRWFPEDDPLRIASTLVDEEFKGASTLEVLIHTGKENGLHDPDVLARIERAMLHAETLEVDGHPIDKAVSIVDVVKETHQALNENRPAFYTLPRERRLIAQELLLFENSGTDDLEDVTDSSFATARMTIRTPWVDALSYPEFLDEVRESFSEILGDEIEFELTGGAVLFTQIFNNVIVSMARSYLLAFALIAPILVLLIGDLKLGLLAIVPNLIPVYLVLCLMGWADIPMDVSTLLIGGIVLGLAVDDTIHFMHKFNRYYTESGDAPSAIHKTLATTGSALLLTSLVLALGFSVFAFSYLNNGIWFGILTSFATVVAFLADVFVAPALLVLVTRGSRPRVSASAPA
jgi:predicted RND superfamily exporter protein